MNEILITEKLNKVYEKKGNKVQALSGINLIVQNRDYVALQGPSGSGKTTLLNMLGCLDRPTWGRVIIDGIDVTKVNEKELSKIRGDKIGFIFQSFNLIPILNAVENVELPMIRTNIPREERRKKATQLLEKVGLSKRMLHRPDELSAGEQQRVAIARSLANDPAILLADEPTGNLDHDTGKSIMDLLSKLNREMGTTIIVVTHDDDMAKLTKKIIYLKDGQIADIREVKHEIVKSPSVPPVPPHEKPPLLPGDNILPPPPFELPEVNHC